VPFRTAEVANWPDIRDTIVVSLVAGVGLCAAYGFALVGWVRAREHYESGEVGLAAVYGAIGVIGLAITLGGIVLGLTFIAGD
jgi:hypothetical protein